ncbi:MAG: autotransporter domain-containing protein [Coleofasciculus sp. G3-WIS-01]|uniref:autotransporter domain-containing protein n=1 Tax=Coleofasciculus sp. G3-WIS-01 TaxID=3069528 RepID=UPI0032F3D634
MQKQALAIASVLLSTLLPLDASAQKFEEFYIFGDSLSDVGNRFESSQGLFPPSPPYFEGRFTNGLVWVEVLGLELGIDHNRANNFALGGATSEDVLEQVIELTTTRQPLDSNGLYTVWGGANDYLDIAPGTNPTDIDTTTTVNTLSNAVTTLIANGAETIIVVNLPDLGRTPLRLASPFPADAITAAVNQYNRNLNAAMQMLAQNREVQIIPLDVNALVNEVLAEPARYGITNVTEPCLNDATDTVCPNPDEYFFWDEIHPTAAVHELLGEAALAVLISPQTVIPQADIALSVARRQTQTIDARLRSLRGVRETPPEQRVGAFVNGDINFGDKDTSNSEPGYDLTTTGITAGIDYRITGDLAMGVAVGHLSNDTELDDDLGEVEVDGYAVSIYGNYVRGNFYTDAVVSYGWNDYEITRQIEFDNRRATADTEGNQLSVKVNGGYNTRLGNFSYGPTLGIGYDRVEIDDYTEEGALSLNMKVQDQQVESLVLSAGVQAAYVFKAGNTTVTPNIRAIYEHQFANDSREIETELLTQPGIPIRATTDDPDRDYVRLAAGVDVQFSQNFSGAIDYETVVGREDYTDHRVRAQLRYQF